MSHKVSFAGTFTCSTEAEAQHLGECLADMLAEVAKVAGLEQGSAASVIVSADEPPPMPIVALN